jgi:hypothetical protein
MWLRPLTSSLRFINMGAWLLLGAMWSLAHASPGTVETHTILVLTPAIGCCRLISRPTEVSGPL